MSYQVLARKWRPKNFHEMVGQSHVLRALINALDENRLHHAYLFTGTRGVGKTTVARIFAKSLNCDEGISSNPCGVCAACQEINDGRFVDLIEVDAASRTKVEDTREILENVQYAPTRGRYKVYLIDEVHMLSKSSFNALLKTLEEPPEHVKFLLATTDPQKLPMTVLSRCLQFNLKNMSVEMVVGHLENVLAAEQIEFQTPALWQLAKAANGSMRDAMSLTDQSIAFGQGKIITSDVNDMLGNVDASQVQKIVRLLLQVDAKGLLALIQQIADHAPDYLNLLQEVVAYFHTLAIAQMAPSALNNAMYQHDYLIELAQSTTAEHIQLCYQLALQSTSDLKISPDAKVGFEMAMMRIMAFSDQPIIGQIPDLPNSDPIEGSVVQSTPTEPAKVESTPESPDTSTPKSDALSTPNVEPAEDKPTAILEETQPEVATESSSVESAPIQQTPEESQIAQPVIEAVAPVQSLDQPKTQVDNQPQVETVPDLPFSPDGFNQAENTAPAAQNEPTQNHEQNVQTEQVQPMQSEDPSAGLSLDPEIPAKPERVLTNDMTDQELLDEPMIQSDQWIAAFESLNLKGLLGSIFSNAQWVEQDDSVDLVICEQHERLFNPTHLDAIKLKLNEAGIAPQKPVNVQFGPVRQTPYVFQTQRKEIKQKRANIEFAASDIVNYLKEQFSGSILFETVKPIA
ncbi:DNA polymerase III subunit gamma/tau [Marinicellulosiphila megalodicopiae]|uniref:DNA polymerase III subunit gamma/tau n=1 Tax=Marinicellulosiphila megalodicopiae TaxID=2724896 RepID=UPI003BAE7972